MPAFKPGRPGAKYHIINAKSETLLDLSVTDPDHKQSMSKSFISDLHLTHGSHVVIGWPDNGGDNQKVRFRIILPTSQVMLIVVQWHIEDLGDTGLVILKNVLYNKYVGFAGELRPGAPAIGVPHRREWDLRREEEGIFRYYTIMYAYQC